jgi:protein-tyrosine phosphatase
MSNFLDIHQHLAYGVDDGAQSLEDMQKMILRAAEEGVTDIVCTTHATPGVEPFPMEKYLAHLEDGRAFILAEGINMRLYSGCEVLYTDASARLAQEGQFPTLAGSDLVLVEFSPDASFRRLCDAASSFGMAGYSVLFAHVERYRCFLWQPEKALQLKEDLHVFYQVNADAILDNRRLLTKCFVRRMLAEQGIDAVASDAHGSEFRPQHLLEAYRALKQSCGEKYADALVNFDGVIR